MGERIQIRESRKLLFGLIEQTKIPTSEIQRELDELWRRANLYDLNYKYLPQASRDNLVLDTIKAAKRASDKARKQYYRLEKQTEYWQISKILGFRLK